MRRWNGWGDERIETRSRRVARAPGGWVGPGDAAAGRHLDEASPPCPPRDSAAPARLTPTPGRACATPAARACPTGSPCEAAGSGACPTRSPRPTDAEAVRALLDLAATSARSSSRTAAGRASSVASRRTPDDRPLLTVDLGRAGAACAHLDERSGLATSGRARTGPALEAALAPHGLTLGHYPQSFERSTLGGWVVARSGGQQSCGFGRIEDLFAGGRLETPAGALDLPPSRRRPPGPTCASSSSARRAGWASSPRRRSARSPVPTREVVPRVVPRRSWPRALTRRAGSRGRAAALDAARLDAGRDRDHARARRPRPVAAGAPRRTCGSGGSGPERCLLLVGASAANGASRAAARRLGSTRPRPGRHRRPASVGLAGTNRFATPYLRNALWDAGYASTRWRRPSTGRGCRPWRQRSAGAPPRARGRRRARPRLQPPVARVPDRIEPLLDVPLPAGHGPGRDPRALAALKSAASRRSWHTAATISHQHGVGTRPRAVPRRREGRRSAWTPSTPRRARFDPNG